MVSAAPACGSACRGLRVANRLCSLRIHLAVDSMLATVAAGCRLAEAATGSAHSTERAQIRDPELQAVAPLAMLHSANIRNESSQFSRYSVVVAVVAVAPGFTCANRMPKRNNVAFNIFCTKKQKQINSARDIQMPLNVD